MDLERQEVVVPVVAYPEEWFHLHGKALSGLQHSHPLRDGEDPDDPDHRHAGEDADDETQARWSEQDIDRRGDGPALYRS